MKAARHSKKNRREMRIRDVTPLLTSLTVEYRFCLALRSIAERAGERT